MAALSMFLVGHGCFEGRNVPAFTHENQSCVQIMQGIQVSLCLSVVRVRGAPLLHARCSHCFIELRVAFEHYSAK
jgi:hypothetical protein